MILNMSLSRYNASDGTPLDIGRGRGLHSTPVPFSLSDHRVGDRKMFDDDDSVHCPFKYRDEVGFITSTT